MGRFKEELKEKARQHDKWVRSTYSTKIRQCTSETTVYSAIAEQPKDGPTANISVIATDTVSAIVSAAKDGGRIAALNFASYKNPGGMFLEGSNAQEEALCHKSILFPVLQQLESIYYKKNREMLHYGLYADRCLYSKSITFFTETEDVFCDVITCAAPNMHALKYHESQIHKNAEAVKQRCSYVVQIAKIQNVDTLILGAWGCGVFEQDPMLVAASFATALNEYHIPNVIFAVPGGRNLQAFREVFDK